MKAGFVIKLLRITSDTPQSVAADKLGVTRSYLSQVENGHREPSLAFLRQASRQFEIPVSLLLVEEGDDSKVMKELREMLTELLSTKMTLWSRSVS